MAVCKVREAMVADVAKRAIVQIKKDNPNMVGKDIRAKAKEVAEAIVDKSQALAEGPVSVESSAAIKANATTARRPLPKDIPTVPVPKAIKARHDEYHNNPSNKSHQAIVDIETAYGYRNADGELLVKFAQPRKVLGSSKESTTESFDEEFTDATGTMASAFNINEHLIDDDKANNVDNFNEDHSKFLTNQLEGFAKVAKGFSDIGIKLKKATLKKSLDGKQGSYGTYDPNTGEIEVNVDTHGPGQEFRDSTTMTNQETFLHELTHAVTQFIFDDKNLSVAKDTEVTSLKSALQDLYTKALKESTWETLLPDNPTKFEEEKAKEMWKYIFENENNVGLQEFTASIMTNEMFRNGMRKLKSLDTKEEKENETALEKVQRWFNNLLEKIVGYSTNKRDNSITDEGSRLLFAMMKANSNAVEVTALSRTMKSVNEGLDTIQEKVDLAESSVKGIMGPVSSLVDKIENHIDEGTKKGTPSEVLQEMKELQRKLNKLSGKAKGPATGNRATIIFKNAFNFIAEVLRFIRKMPIIFKMRKLTYGNKRSKAMSELFAKNLDDMLTSVNLVQDGMVRSVMRDFFDKPGVYNYLADHILKLTHEVDGVRQATFEGVHKELREEFGNVRIENDILNKDNNKALNDVLLRTDIQALGLDAKELLELLKDPAEVASRISKLEKGLNTKQKQAAKSMASYMITGVGAATNEENIDKWYGTAGKGGKVRRAKQIDQLISMRALALVKDDTKETLIDFMEGNKYSEYSTTLWAKAKKATGFNHKKEMSKEKYVESVMNGVDFYMTRAYGLQQASKEELRANPHQRIKGYIKETFNTDYTMETYPMSEKARLLKDGYKFVKEIKKLKGAKGEYGVFISNAPELKRANGALGLQAKKARGTDLKDIVNREAADEGGVVTSVERDKRFSQLLADTLEQYLEDPTELGMQPVYDEAGNIVNFRSTMSIADKEKFMDLEVKGTENLARSYSVMGTASKTAYHNREVIDAIHKDYVDNFDKSSDSAYVEISPMKDGAEQTKYDKLWAKLPSDTKKYAKEVFGSNKIVIKKELLTIAFGEDNWSITKLKALDNLPAKHKARLLEIESRWQDIMQIAKSNIVIKTPEVFIGNIVSNFKILVYLGVHPIKGLDLILSGMKQLKRYESEKKELAKLQRDELSGLSPNKARMKQLEKSIKENPVSPLIDKGLYQSIVEDVDTSGSLNRTSGWFDEKLDKFVPNEIANTAIQHIFMTQKTKPYKAMLKATQMSDFLFRYAQYYDAIDNKGHSKEKAMRDAIDNYINYESPVEKHVRYGDAMGTWFFVKYFIRIQKVIKKIALENPVRMGADIMLQTFVTGDTADIQDSSFLDKGLSTYNPFAIYKRFMEVVSPAGLELVSKAV